MEEQLSRTFVVPWHGWLSSIALLVLVGFMFGLAVILPRTTRFDAVRAAILGLIPLVIVVHLTLIFGPARQYSADHLQFLLRHFAEFELMPGRYVAPVLMGLALAAGFDAEG